MAEPFRFRFRVRYHECDAQGIVFNARWGDYVDVACTELARRALGAADAADWRLVKQTLEWRSPGRFDDVLEARVTTRAIGTTSFTLATSFHRAADGTHLASAETIYVVVDAKAGTKQPVPDALRAALTAGITGLVDATGTGAA
jgi:acyl-CoA thioester hydrolase